MDIYVGLIPIITRFHGDCQAISVEFCRWAGGFLTILMPGPGPRAHLQIY